MYRTQDTTRPTLKADGAMSPWFLRRGSHVWSAVTAICILASTTAAWARHSPRATAWAEALRAAAAAAKGRPDLAAKHFERSLNSQESPLIRAALFLTLPTAGNLARFDRLARTKGTHASIHYWLARLQMCRAPAKACRTLVAAISLAPDSPKILLAEALACRGSHPARARRALAGLVDKTWDIMDPTLYPDRLTGILELVRLALRDYPDKTSLLVTMAHLHLTTGHLRQAENLAKRALALRPGHPEALFVLAKALYEAGWQKEAAKQVGRLLSTRPSDPQALAIQAALAIQKGRKAEAVRALDASVRADPTDPVTLSRLGKLLWDRGRPARAEKMFRYALARLPDFAPAHYGLALALANRKRPTEARDHFLAAISASPDNPIYHKGFSFFLQQRGKTSLAAKQMRLANRLERALGRINKHMERMRRFRKALLTAAKRHHAGKTTSQGRTRTFRFPPGPVLPRRFLLAHFDERKRPGALSAAQRLSAKKMLCRSRPVTEVRLSAPAGPGKTLSVLLHLDFADPRLF